MFHKSLIPVSLTDGGGTLKLPSDCVTQPDVPKTRLFSLSAVEVPPNFQPKIQTQNAVSEDVGQL